MNRIEALDKRKVFGTIIGAIVFICCVLFFTYAWYQWQSTNTNVLITIDDPLTECILGPDVNVSNIGPVLDYQDGVKAEFSVENNTTTSANSVSLSLNITSISNTLLVESFRYVLVRDTNGGTNYDYTTPVASGDFSDFIVGTNVITSSLSIAASKTYSFLFIVYIDGTIYNGQDMQENSMNSSLVLGNCGVVYNLK